MFCSRKSTRVVYHCIFTITVCVFVGSYDLFAHMFRIALSLALRKTYKRHSVNTGQSENSLTFHFNCCPLRPSNQTRLIEYTIHWEVHLPLLGRLVYICIQHLLLDPQYEQILEHIKHIYISKNEIYLHFKTLSHAGYWNPWKTWAFHPTDSVPWFLLTRWCEVSASK